MSHRKAAVVLYLTTAVFCAAAFVLVLLRNPVLALVLAAAAGLQVVGLKLWAILTRPEGAEAGEAAPGAEGPLPATGTLGAGRLPEHR